MFVRSIFYVKTTENTVQVQCWLCVVSSSHSDSKKNELLLHKYTQCLICEAEMPKLLALIFAHTLFMRHCCYCCCCRRRSVHPNCCWCAAVSFCISSVLRFSSLFFLHEIYQCYEDFSTVLRALVEKEASVFHRRLIETNVCTTNGDLWYSCFVCLHSTQIDTYLM